MDYDDRHHLNSDSTSKFDITSGTFSSVGFGMYIILDFVAQEASVDFPFVFAKIKSIPARVYTF
ncbi:hypothetical protein [Bacillus sp. mrc49]|uniref:hypothetical protein n=1 Tax=Bacillus sp. mrc49 TaxID=2054913 RepID=UPI000C27CEAC|nr:hypothetical protein [Bacillus sp. mrc49]PJN86523.1 hypothetical protein CVN76_30540 [Bacillus sp. mrc49]PJN87924.1 hypothetical protein CVN76_23095 [Bacillus sp. mrc49]